MSPKSDSGQRIRDFFGAEVKALMDSYRNIETLIPAQNRSGSAHTGEEGRHIESILRSFLNRHLPANLKALSGFILRPATKTHRNRRERIKQGDEHSTQLDVIIYDVANFPIYEHFEEFVVVPPEGVVGVVSVKKNFYKSQLVNEIEVLSNVVRLCRHRNPAGTPVRGPNVALLTFSNCEPGSTEDNVADFIFKTISDRSGEIEFDQLVGQVVILDSLTVFKARPELDGEDVKPAQYITFKHKDNQEQLGLQFLLTGILSVFYDETRFTIARPGFTSFQSGKSQDRILGTIPVKGLRCKD